MQSIRGLIYFGQLVFILITLCDGTERHTSGRHSTDVTKDVAYGSEKETHSEYVEAGIVTGSEDDVNGLGETPWRNEGDRIPLSTDRNTASSVGVSRRFPKHATTHTGTTRQRQLVTVTKWYLDHNGKRVNRTSGGSFSRGASRHSSSQRSRPKHSGVYPGTYVRSRSRAGSGVSSARRTSTPRRRTYIPRTKAALEARSRSPVYDGPVQTSKTYVYPFAGKYPQGRDRIAASRIPHDSTHERSPYPLNPGRRGRETQALSSGEDAHQTSRSRLQANPRESSITPENTFRREKQFSSNSSVTSSLNRQRATQSRTWGRISDPTRFDPKANPRRTPSVPDTGLRTSYRQDGGSRHTQWRSRNYPSTQTYTPSGGNAHSSSARGTQYYASRPNAQKPQVQRTFRRNRVSTGYSRYPGSYPQRNPYQGRSTGSLFTSYDVADDGECPNTGIDLRINGLGCQQAVQSYGQYLCYLHEYTSKECCETCIHRKRPEQVGCEYGDHARLCNGISPSDCYDRRNEMSCCQTCARFKKVGAPEMCQWGDMIGSQRCEEVRRNPGLCYMPDNARLCCETCNIVKNITNPSCPWGDQNARMCQIFGSTGDVLINCYSPYRRRLCCESCDRLKQWLPTNMPTDCEYGDRPVIFNTGQFGRVNCAQILKYVSVNECRDNPVISRNCCYTCQRYLNTTSTSTF